MLVNVSEYCLMWRLSRKCSLDNCSFDFWFFHFFHCLDMNTALNCERCSWEARHWAVDFCCVSQTAVKEFGLRVCIAWVSLVLANSTGRIEGMRVWNIPILIELPTNDFSCTIAHTVLDQKWQLAQEDGEVSVNCRRFPLLFSLSLFCFFITNCFLEVWLWLLFFKLSLTVRLTESLLVFKNLLYCCCQSKRVYF